MSEDEVGVCRIPRGMVHTSLPAAGAQANRMDDFGRKPYDVGFYVDKTTVLFLEVKELTILIYPSGKFLEFKADQKSMLEIASDNGVDIRFAYNSWPFSRKSILTHDQVLDGTHVRFPAEMRSEVNVMPIDPARALRGYLDSIIANFGGSEKIVDLLTRNADYIDHLNGMPLMILMNLTESEAEILIDSQPKIALKFMKELFEMPKCERAARMASKRYQKYGANFSTFADRVFAMRDEWDNSNRVRIRPRR